MISLDRKHDNFVCGIQNAVKDEDTAEALLDIYSDISDKAAKNSMGLDDYTLSPDELKDVLVKHDIPSYAADEIIDVCVISSDAAVIKAVDVVDEKFLKKNELYLAYKKLLKENEQLKRELESLR